MSAFEMMIFNDPLFICEICTDIFKICGEFITHLKSEQHIEELLDIVPRDDVEPRHFCQVCNYPGYNYYNMFLHDQSEEHIRKLAESRKRDSLADLSNERNKKQSFERRGKQEEVSSLYMFCEWIFSILRRMNPCQVVQGFISCAARCYYYKKRF